MTIALRTTVPLRPKWLVYQTTTLGELVYAETFYRRSSAEKAQKLANDRTGRRILSARMYAQATRLPFDRR